MITYLHNIQEYLSSFNPTDAKNVHRIMLTIVWSLVANISLIISLYKYRQYSFYVHAILGWIILLATLSNTLTLFVYYGLNYQFGQFSANLVHGWGGLFTVIFVGIQVIIGIFSKIFQKKEGLSTIMVLRSKLIHQIFGYLLLIIAKVTMLIKWYYRDTTIFSLILAWQGVTIPVYVVRKLMFPKLTKKIVNQQAIKNLQIPQISDLSQVSVQNYVIFSNYVYNVQRLKYAHPGGHQIIKTMMGREIDRFIYGMYSSELLPQVHKHEHSFKSLELVGPPIAKLVIPPIYQGSMPQIMNVEIKTKEIVSVNTQIYCIRLYPADGNIFRFVGYTDVKQLGQHYSLTIDDKKTRLYTSVQFTRKENIQFIKKVTPSLSYSTIMQNINSQKQLFQNESTEIASLQILLTKDLKIQQNEISDYIPLMMKKYDQGALTSKLFSQNWSGKLKLSAPKGEGLKFSTLQPGKIIIVCGGTGLLPFADLIDLLFKQKLVNQGHHLKEQILKYNPILKNKPFEGFNFLLLAAFNFPQDIHPISLYQISELCKDNHKFRSIFRLKNQQSKVQSLYPQINCIRQKFKKVLVDQARKQQLSKIWICGPPKLNTETANILLQNGFTQHEFLFI